MKPRLPRMFRFQSTLSLRRATTKAPEFCIQIIISIHALLAESDVHPLRQLYYLRYFNPRSPCGERPVPWISRTLRFTFQSTLSLRRATGDPLGRGEFLEISIHALLAESDCNFPPRAARGKIFQSTLSLRRATLAATLDGMQEA